MDRFRLACRRFRATRRLTLRLGLIRRGGCVVFHDFALRFENLAQTTRQRLIKVSPEFPPPLAARPRYRIREWLLPTSVLVDQGLAVLPHTHSPLHSTSRLLT